VLYDVIIYDVVSHVGNVDESSTQEETVSQQTSFP